MLNEEPSVNNNNNGIAITETPTSLSSSNYIHNTHNEIETIKDNNLPSPQTPSPSIAHPLSDSSIDPKISLSKQHTIPLQQQRFRYKRVRRTLLLLSDKNGNALFSIGPDWGFFVFLMLLMIF